MYNLNINFISPILQYTLGHTNCFAQGPARRCIPLLGVGGRGMRHVTSKILALPIFRSAGTIGPLCVVA